MEKIHITYIDNTSETFNTNDWDDYKIVDNFFCVRRNEKNVGIFNMECVKSIIIE